MRSSQKDQSRPLNRANRAFLVSKQAALPRLARFRQIGSSVLYDRILEDGDASCISKQEATPSVYLWKNAAEFVDSIPVKRETRFDNMTDAEIRVERLHSRGLM